MAESVTAYLGLGSNLGDRLAALTEALRFLDATPGMRRVACSSVYETEPWGITDQPSFLNLVAAFETTLAAVDLLAASKQVESQVGRTESYRWGPRLIDVDILLYGDQVVSVADPDLQIPHPRMTQRAFVLVPLAEIAADTIVPGLGKQAPQLLSRADGVEGVVRWGDGIPLE
ncbi:MAG: 2-amino-4-hydroxy-6-hydroxymethyldihydropteridine diphosphokinase [Chloroflexota bacterium]|nr:2-amino-4-hydroxy-6-hydroxymethyldihydropteridine diphosphokinase [Chloroflexota bacterium]